MGVQPLVVYIAGIELDSNGLGTGSWHFMHAAIKRATIITYDMQMEI